MQIVFFNVFGMYFLQLLHLHINVVFAFMLILMFKKIAFILIFFKKNVKILIKASPHAKYFLFVYDIFIAHSLIDL